MEATNWPAKASGYKLHCPIGLGSFGLVWKASCIEGPNKDKNIAIKVIDLEQFVDNSIDDIRKEIAIMSTCKHPNVITYHVSFIEKTDLWLVMPILGAGSAADVIKDKYPMGIKNEAVIATLLLETLKGLSYFHSNG